MKIALVLAGVVGNKQTKAGSKKSAPEILNLGYEKYKEALLDKYDVDVYLHSWSVDFEKEILELYKPKGHIIEKQEFFDIPAHVRGDSPSQPNRRHNHYSRWRSTQKALNLVKKSGIEYDYVLLSRYDIAFEKMIDFSSLDKNKIYCSKWMGVSYDQAGDIFNDGVGIYYKLENKIDTSTLRWYNRGYPYDREGILDIWFVANSKNIQIFSDLFDKIGEYMVPGRCPQAPLVSSHKLSLYHIIQKGKLKDLEFITNPVVDHCVLRYKYFGAKI